MTRNIRSLSHFRFDLVVIGGGVYGACTAFEAARRGLSVALIDQSDFGSATSSNSQKIAHGGLRYLQTLDFKRMRESIRERRTLLRIAPHLVKPLPFLVPIYRGKPARSRAVFRAGFALNDLVGWDRNRGIRDSFRVIPGGRVLGVPDTLRLAPGLLPPGLCGGAVWADAQIQDTERLTLSYICSAVDHGTVAANYVRAAGFLRQCNRVAGVAAEDMLTGERLEIRAQAVINAAGPWVGRVLASSGRVPDSPLQFLKAVNVVVRRQPVRGIALGLPVRPHLRSVIPGYLFITPWQGHAVIGTAYMPFQGAPENVQASEAEIQLLLDEANAAYPAASLKRPDVSFVHAGLLPAARGGTRLERRYRLIDHSKDKLSGLISVVGVKYTTARNVAEQAVSAAFRLLRRRNPAGRQQPPALRGGSIPDVEALIARESARAPRGLAAAVVRRLVSRYGTAYTELLEYLEAEPALAAPLPGSEAIGAEIAHAARREMAVTLGDALFRRTGIASAGNPGEACVRECARLLARELGWDAARTRREIDAVNDRFSRIAAPPASAGAAWSPLHEVNR